MIELNLGIIGSGFGLYGLLPAFHSLKKCAVVAFCGEKTERVINYCQSIGLQNIYTEWRSMLEEEKLDAVAIAVTPGMQYLIVKAAIEKGLHVFAEKPLALTYSQAKNLLNLATGKKITHAVDFIFPEIDEWQKVKRLLDSKECGNLKRISLNWDFLSYDIKNKISSWKTNVAQGGGALSFYFSHSLYYLEYFAGKITKIQGNLHYSKESLNGGEVGVDIVLKFKNNIDGKAHFRCDIRDLHRHQLIFECEKGTIVLENRNSVTQNFTIKVYIDSGNEIITSTPTTREAGEDERVAVVRSLAAKFIHACLEKKQMTPSMRDGARVQELIETIKKSI